MRKKNILRSGRLFLNGRLCSTKTLSPHVRESKTSWDSWFHAVDSGFQVLDSSLGQWNLDSGFQSLVGFRIPWAVFRIPLAVFRIPQAKISHIPESGFLNMGRTLTLPLFSHFLCHNQQGWYLANVAISAPGSTLISQWGIQAYF